MYSNKSRIICYIQNSIEEIGLIEQMSRPIEKASDFGLNLNGLTIFRACSMSLQYITENFIKVRNLTTEKFFERYREVPWQQVFGMRNFLAHEYADIDDNAIFNTIRNDMPTLKSTSEKLLKDLEDGFLDEYIK